jgi:hypothetical protein
MIEVNKFSGNVYTQLGGIKQSNDGEIFMKCGNSWAQTVKLFKFATMTCSMCKLELALLLVIHSRSRNELLPSHEMGW